MHISLKTALLKYNIVFGLIKKKYIIYIYNTVYFYLNIMYAKFCDFKTGRIYDLNCTVFNNIFYI